MSKAVYLGGDHAGFELKEHLRIFLETKGYEVIDKGPYDSQSVDYPDFVKPVCDEVLSKTSSIGILICGSGQGVCMTANKHKGIRAALCWMPELASLTRQHNNANVLCLAGRFIAPHLAELIVHAFLTSDFEGGRHQRRVDKIEA